MTKAAPGLAEIRLDRFDQPPYRGNSGRAVAAVAFASALCLGLLLLALSVYATTL